MTEHPHGNGFKTATPITAEEIVARGGKRVVAFQLDPPKENSAAARQARHRKGKEERGLKQLNILVKDDAGVRARLREIGAKTLQPSFERALQSLHARGDDDDFVAVVAALQEPDMWSAVLRVAAATPQERARVLESLGAVTEADGDRTWRPCEVQLLRRAKQLKDEEVEALVYAASPDDKRLRGIALAAQRNPEILKHLFAFARLDATRRRRLLTIKDSTLGLVGEIESSPELAEIVRAVAKDRKLARHLRNALLNRASGKDVRADAPSGAAVPRQGWLSRLRSVFAGRSAPQGRKR